MGLDGMCFESQKGATLVDVLRVSPGSNNLDVQIVFKTWFNSVLRLPAEVPRTRWPTVCFMCTKLPCKQEGLRRMQERFDGEDPVMQSQVLVA